MGLLPLEYTDCLTDTPHFRENLRAHEKELDRTNQAIKGLIKEVKDLLSASKALSRAQRSFARTLMNFRFDCIGCSQTDDEIIIGGSLKEFGRLLNVIEDERDRMLDRAQACLIDPIENFRKQNIGAAKEGKKKFEKETTRFCQSLERHLNLSTKKGENHLQEADASLDLEQRHFFKASLEYAFLLTQIQERKKFEFVETILSFMTGMMTFYHQGYEIANEYKSFMTDLSRRLQRIRENFEATHNEAEQLKQKTLEKAQDPGTLNKMYTRQGYLFLMEKKALGTTWTKHFVQYQKSQKKFSMMPYSQTAGKIMNGETITIKECIRRQCDSIDKRFCFDVVPEDKSIVYTFQALSDDDRKLWLDAMDGKEPIYCGPGKNCKIEEYALDDHGFHFAQWCISFVEMRGLTDHGLYRLVGVNSKVSKFMQMALDKRKLNVTPPDDEEWEIKTVTSALKNFFRNLPEPLLTFRLHNAFIAAAKQENKVLRINNIHTLIHSLPSANMKMLDLLIKHLCKIAKLSDKNLMTVSNLGVCFGPTLLRPEEETVAAIMDIKFGNVVVEILVENYDKIFNSTPEIDNTRKQPPPYVAPPQPSKRDEHYRPPPQQQTSPIRVPPPPSSTSDIYNYQNSLAFSPTNYGQINASQGGNYAPTDQKPRPGLMVYNPMWNDNMSLSTVTDAPKQWTGPPPRPPLPSSRDYANTRAESISSQHRIPPVSVIDESSSRDIYPPPHSNEHMTEAMYSTVHKSPTSSNNNNIIPRKVQTLYACRGENEMELSFEPHEIIYNVQPSHDPGWLFGTTARGKTGLIPENYVEYIP